MAEQEREKHTDEDLARIKRDILTDSAFLDKLTDEIAQRLAKRIQQHRCSTYSPVKETK